MLAASSSRPGRRRIALLLLFVGIVLLMTRMSWSTMNEKVADLGDPVLFGWSWNWMRDVILSHPAHLYDGNIFFPHPLSVAYTDNMVVLLAPFALLRALGASWALELNLLTLGMMLFSLVATYALAVRLTRRVDASVFAAVAYTFSGFTYAHLGHLQLLLLGQFPLAVLLAFRWFERRRPVDAVWFGLANVSFFIGSLYYAAVWTVCAAVIVLGYLIALRFRPGRRFWTGLAIAAVASAVTLPFIQPYFQLGQERALVPEWGFNPSDVVTVPAGSILYSGLDEWANDKLDRWEHTFFPGFTTLLFGGVGVAVLATGTIGRGRGRAKAKVARPLETWLLIAAGTAAVVLAIGPDMHGVTMPFTWFHDHVPGFRGIRVAARLAMPGFLALAVLAGVGLGAILDRRREPAATVLGIAAIGFLLLELATPLNHVVLPDGSRRLATYRALDREPAGTVVELPMQSPVDGAAWARVEAPRMLYSTLDLHPRVNGYSGSWPDGYLAAVQQLNRFPAPAALRTVHRLHVRYVVLHTGVEAGYAQYFAFRRAHDPGPLASRGDGGTPRRRLARRPRRGDRLGAEQGTRDEIRPERGEDREVQQPGRRHHRGVVALAQREPCDPDQDAGGDRADHPHPTEEPAVPVVVRATQDPDHAGGHQQDRHLDRQHVRAPTHELPDRITGEARLGEIPVAEQHRVAHDPEERATDHEPQAREPYRPAGESGGPEQADHADHRREQVERRRELGSPDSGAGRLGRLRIASGFRRAGHGGHPLRRARPRARGAAPTPAPRRTTLTTSATEAATTTPALPTRKSPWPAP